MSSWIGSGPYKCEECNKDYDIFFCDERIFGTKGTLHATFTLCEECGVKRLMRKQKHALELARQDLCFAIQHMSKSDMYNSRLFGTVLFITDVLNDKEIFIEYMKKNNMLCPDCKFNHHFRSCELHGD